MSDYRTDNENKIPKIQNGNMFTFAATLSGVVVGVFASMAMMVPTLRAQITSATKNNTHTIALAPASSTSACSVPSGSGGTAGNTTATASTPLAGGRGGDEALLPGGKGGDDSTTPGNTWVHNFVSGIWATNTATMSNTGPESTNIIRTTNTNTTTVHNDNDVHVTNNNEQTAKSGSVTSEENTTAGSAASGTASNTSQNKFDISITN